MIQSTATVLPGRAEDKRGLSLAQLTEMYRAMLGIRTLDERMMTLQRQGRVGFYGACTGQEAACIGSAFALRPTDWIFPALREGAAMLMRGFRSFPTLLKCSATAATSPRAARCPRISPRVRSTR